MAYGEPTGAVRRAACGLMPEWHDADVHVLGFLEGGYSHRNYRLRAHGQDYAIRLPQGLTAAQRDFERRWWQQLPAALSAPLIRYDRHTGILLTRWVDGPLLVHAERDEGALVRYIRALHADLPDPKRRYDLGALVDSWLAGERQPAVQRARALIGRASKQTMTACHNDLNPWNVICAEPAWVTLDWEMVGRNDPLFDVIVAGYGLDKSANEVLSLCEAYLDGTPEAGRFERLSTAFWLREFAWAHNQLARGNERPEVARQRDDALARLSG